MPKQNPYLIENKKPFETVQELKNEVPSFEEFMKTYESDEGIINSYNFEVDGYKDIGVGKRSGPMPFGSDSSIVASSHSIMNESAFSAYRGQNAFRDERPAYDTFKASFRGSPEVKLLVLDLYELRRLEEKCERVGIEEAKNNYKEDLEKRVATRNLKDCKSDPETTPKLIEQELKRLENISEEEFNKTDNKEIDNIFGLENGKLPKEEKPIEKDNNTENEELKNNRNLTSSERQERLQKNQQKLEELNSYYSAGSHSSSQPNNSNDKFPTG
nr:2929_t:CDS:2 [Entrophospora candida]